jgi:hypothetical protein
LKGPSSIFAILIASILVFAYGCKHQIEEDVTLNGGSGDQNPIDTIDWINPHPCSPDSIYFVNDILPFITSNCAMSGCHDLASTEQEPYTNYAQINQRRNDILDKISQGSMPPWDSGITLTSAQIEMFQLWIQQGHLNNECMEDCDSTQNSFAGNIAPIMHDFCEGCHSGVNPSGGVPLTSFAEIQDAALNGNLLHSLYGTNGVSIMPDNTAGLPECYIHQIENWINLGAPNN